MKGKTKVFSKIIACCLAAVMTVGSDVAAFAAKAYSPLAAGIKPVAVTKANFPDDIFRNYVSREFDDDGNGILDPDELLVARNIYCDWMGIESLKGIEHLVELRGVYASHNNLTELDLSKNKYITGVWVDYNKFKRLSFSANANTFEWLYCNMNPTLTELDLKGCNKLSYLECRRCNLKTIDVSGFPLLEQLICSECALTTLDVSKNTNLTHLDIYNEINDTSIAHLYNNITKLDLSKNKKLKRLDVWGNKNLKYVDISPCQGLQSYNCAAIGATTVDISKNPKLTSLNCGWNALGKLNLANNPKLAHLRCNSCQISSLDISKNPELRILFIGSNKISTVNIGNNPFLMEAYKKGSFEKEYTVYPDGVVPSGKSWTFNYGGDSSTGDDQKLYIWVDDDVNVTTNGNVSMSTLYPDRDKGLTNTSNLMTREDFVQMLYELAGKPSVSGLKTRFTDVKAGSYYENAIKWGESISMCMGYPYFSADVFGVGKYISRQDALFMLMRYSEYKDYKRSIDFGRSDDYLDYYDIDYDHWEAICWCATWHILEGKGPAGDKTKQKMDPYGKATLDEIDLMIENLFDINGIPMETVTTRRYAGTSRYATAAAISKAGFPNGASTVVLANGTSYADALAGVPLATQLNAPILLTDANGLDSSTLTEIKRLKASKVVILGGKGAVGQNVVNTLVKNGIKNENIERIAGGTRYSTATSIAQKLNTAPSEIFFVYGENYADALSVSTVAALRRTPVIYLTKNGSLNADTAAYLAKVKSTVKRAYVIGGNGVISDDMLNKAGKALGITPTRVYGADRYETCIAVNKAFKGVLTGNSICVATGADFPDALAGGVFAAKNKSPLVLVNGKSASPTLSSSQREFLKSRTINLVYVFGGTGAVPESHVARVARKSII